jgi:hypothetical protein
VIALRAALLAPVVLAALCIWLRIGIAVAKLMRRRGEAESRSEVVLFVVFWPLGVLALGLEVLFDWFDLVSARFGALMDRAAGWLHRATEP